MAHPKRKISKQRRNKRRTHLKLKKLAFSICSKTGETHLRHHAYFVEKNMYYRGKVIINNSDEDEE